VDLANEGEYLCGLAHSPRFIDETIAQAQAAVGRATTVLSKTHLEIPGQVAKVDPASCVACATCVKVCPYGAPMINDLHKAEIQGAKCMGAEAAPPPAPPGPSRSSTRRTRRWWPCSTSCSSAEASHESVQPMGTRIIAFCCNYCAYAAADLAGSKRMQYPVNVRIIHTPCTGKLEMEHILEAFEKGIDGILVAGCLEGGCHFLEATCGRGSAPTGYARCWTRSAWAASA